MQLSTIAHHRHWKEEEEEERTLRGKAHVMEKLGNVIMRHFPK